MPVFLFMKAWMQRQFCFSFGKKHILSIIWESLAFQTFPYLQYNLLFIMEGNQPELETSNTVLLKSSNRFVVIKVTNSFLIANLFQMKKLQTLSSSKKYVKKGDMKIKIPVESLFFFFFSFSISLLQCLADQRDWGSLWIWFESCRL